MLDQNETYSDRQFTRPARSELAPLLFINAPSLDTAGFLGAPTGLYYAVGPLVERINSGGLSLPRLQPVNFYDPRLVDRLEDDLVQRLISLKPWLVGISQTSEAHHIALKMAEIVRRTSGKDTTIVFGGPHEDEVSFSPRSEERRVGKEC